MKKSYLLKFCGLIVALLASIQAAHATLDWSWDFDEYRPVVGQNDGVTLHATLFNFSTSTEVMTQSSILNGFVTAAGGLPYEFSMPAGGFLEQFAGMHLDPGASFSFIFGTYTPIDAPIAVGEYFGDGFGVQVRDLAGRVSGWTPDRDLVITVQADDSAQIPEPASLALLAAGLGGVCLSRRRRS